MVFSQCFVFLLKYSSILLRGKFGSYITENCVIFKFVALRHKKKIYSNLMLKAWYLILKNYLENTDNQKNPINDESPPNDLSPF